MALTAAELIKSDHEHLIHPLHHPVDTAEPMIYVRGRGATLTDVGGKEYLDGLAGRWAERSIEELVVGFVRSAQVGPLLDAAARSRTLAQAGSREVR